MERNMDLIRDILLSIEDLPAGGPHHNPADRAAQYLAEALLSPDPKTSKSLRNAKSAEERQAIMKAWLRRVDGIKTALRREGVDADALLKQHQAFQQAITRADELTPCDGTLTKTYATQVVTVPTGIEVDDE